MNRAILVVICDFVVLSMMSLTDFGTVARGRLPGDGRPGTVLDAALSRDILAEAAARLERLEAEYRLAAEAARDGDEAAAAKAASLASELAAARVQVEYLTERLALTPENMGELSPEAMLRLWEKEARSRELAEVRYETISDEVAYLRNSGAEISTELRAVSENLAAERARNAAAGERIDELTVQAVRWEEVIRARESSIAEKDLTIAEKNASIADERRRVEVLSTELGNVRAVAEKTAAELDETRSRLQEESSRLAAASAEAEYQKGRLEAAQSENEENRILLAEVRSRLEQARQEASRRELEAAELRNELAAARKLLSGTVDELTETRSALEDKTRETAAAVDTLRQLQNRYQDTAEQLKDAESRLSSDVMPSYRASVDSVMFRLREERLFVDFRDGREFFWPEIVLDGRKFIIGDIRTLTGYAENNYSEKVRELVVGARAPGENNLAGISRLLLPAADRRVVLMEVPGIAGEALRPMTGDELMKRGLNDLYVFKADRHGGECFLLGDRGVLDIENNGHILKIRNRRRGVSAAALAVEPGDFILSREGDFVGIAVGMSPRRADGDDEALVFVFPAGAALDGAVEIPLTADSDGGYFRKFVKTLAGQSAAWKQLDAAGSR